MLFTYNWDVFDPEDKFNPFVKYNLVFNEEMKKIFKNHKLEPSEEIFRALCEEACQVQPTYDPFLWDWTNKLIFTRKVRSK